MMMNALSQVSKDTDIGKQMAYMRNYINQLRDEIENDLMNIGYDNLDADLRKRFDDMQTGLLTANNTSMEVAGMLKTQYLKADQIVATYATIGSLNAVSARIGVIEANYITASEVSATYATIGSLNAVSASITTLSSKAITTDNLNATMANFNGTIGVHHVIGDSGSEILADRYDVLDGGSIYFSKAGSPNVYLDYDRVKTILERL